jgi:hypothetical protein
MTKNVKKFKLKKLQFTYPSASKKMRSSYRRSLQHSKRISSTSKHELFKNIFVGHFSSPGSGFGSTDLIG